MVSNSYLRSENTNPGVGMSVLEENKAIAREFLMALAHRLPKQFEAITHDDFESWMIGNWYPGGTVHDKAWWLKLLSSDAEHFEGGKLEMHLVSFTAEDDRVAVEAVSYAKTVRGENYNNHYHFHIVVRDRKVVLSKEYMDTQHAAEVVLPCLPRAI
jgi:ketosteroid isomerase-like protein